MSDNFLEAVKGFMPTVNRITAINNCCQHNEEAAKMAAAIHAVGVAFLVPPGAYHFQRVGDLWVNLEDLDDGGEGVYVIIDVSHASVVYTRKTFKVLSCDVDRQIAEFKQSN